jgi:hypothetical protein
MTAVMVRPDATTQVAAATEPDLLVKSHRPRWPWWAALAAFIQYTVLGVWLMKVQGYLLLDNASRTITARILVSSRDPHLGAMGFYWPPLPMLIRVPLVMVLAPFHQGPLTGAISTSILAALVLPVLAAIGRELRLSTGQTVLLVGLYALNPVVVFYAINGLSEAAFSLFLAIAFLGYLRFCKTKDVRDMRLISVGLALGMMCRIEFIPVTIGFVVACALQLPRDRWKRATFVIALPPLYVFALWSWASSILAGDALYWYHAGKASGHTPDVHPWLPERLTFVNVVAYVAKMSLIYAPVLGLLFFSVFVRGVSRTNWLGMVLLSLVLPSFIALELVLRATTGEQRYFATLVLVGSIAAMWVLSSAEALPRPGRLGVNGLVVVALIGSALAVVPLNNDKSNSSLTGQQVYYGALTGNQPASPRNYIGNLDALLAVLDPELADGERVAMDSRGGLALLLTQYPEQFIVPEDRDFEEIMSDPEGRFTYVIRPTVDLGSAYGDAIDNAMKSAVNGKFEMVKKVEAAELWKYVPNAP